MYTQIIKRIAPVHKHISHMPVLTAPNDEWVRSDNMALLMNH